MVQTKETTVADYPDGVVAGLAGKMTVEEYLRLYTRARGK